MAVLISCIILDFRIFLKEGFFKTSSFMLLVLLNQGINPTDPSQKPQRFALRIRQNAIFAVFSKNVLTQNRLRIILKLVLKKPQVSFFGIAFFMPLFGRMLRVGFEIDFEKLRKAERRDGVSESEKRRGGGCIWRESWFRRIAGFRL